MRDTKIKSYPRYQSIKNYIKTKLINSLLDLNLQSRAYGSQQPIRSVFAAGEEIAG
jgi:hypothetical protein